MVRINFKHFTLIENFLVVSNSLLFPIKEKIKIIENKNSPSSIRVKFEELKKSNFQGTGIHNHKRPLKAEFATIFQLHWTNLVEGGVRVIHKVIHKPSESLVLLGP